MNHLSVCAMAVILAGAVLAQNGQPEAQEPTKPPPTLEDLQRQIDELREAQAQMPVTGGDAATMKVFGRINLDAWGFLKTDPGINVFETGNPSISPANNIEFRRVRIGVSGEIVDDMVYKLEIDFGHPNNFAFKDVYIGWNNLPVVQTLLVGNQKRPYGLDHLNSSRYNLFMERPFVVEANNQDSRRLGIAAYGVSDDKVLNWRYGIYDMTDLSKIGGLVTDHVQPQLAARLATTAWYDGESGGRYYGHFAVSGSVGFPEDNPRSMDPSAEDRFRTRPEARSQSRWLDTGTISGAEQVYLVGLESVVNIDSVQLAGEYQSVWVSRNMGLATANFFGAYVEAAWFVTGEHMPWSRKSGTLGRPGPSEDSQFGAWQLACRYSYADYTNQDIFGGVGHALTLGVNWFWNDHAGLQFNYLKGRISDRQVVANGTTYTGGDYDIFGVRLRVDF